MKEFRALENILGDQFKELGAIMTSRSRSGRQHALASREKPQPVFSSHLGRHILARLTELEARCDRLVRQAEAAGDFKTALTATRVSFNILSRLARLGEKLPHLAETWQPAIQDNRPPAPELSSQAGEAQGNRNSAEQREIVKDSGYQEFFGKEIAAPETGGMLPLSTTDNKERRSRGRLRWGGVIRLPANPDSAVAAGG